MMNDIARDTFDYDKFAVVTQLMWEALENQRPAAWRVIFKGLTLLEHLLKNGSERCVDDARNHGATLRSLHQFNYYEGTVDRGVGVRELSKKIVDILGDDERIREERQKARKLREKFGEKLGGVSSDGMSTSKYAGYGNDSGWSSGGGGGGGGSSGGYGDGGIGSEKYRSKATNSSAMYAGRYDDESSSRPSASPAPAPTFASIPDEPKKKTKSKKKKAAEDESAPAPAPEIDLFSFDAPSTAPAASGFGADLGAPPPSDEFADFQTGGTSSAGAAHDPFAASPAAFSPQSSQPTSSFDAFGNAPQQQPTTSFGAFGNMAGGTMNGMQSTGFASPTHGPASNFGGGGNDDDDFGDFAAAPKGSPEKISFSATSTATSSDPLSKLISLDSLTKNSEKNKPDMLHQPVIANAAAATFVQEQNMISQQIQQGKKGNMNSFAGLDGLGKSSSSGTTGGGLSMGMMMSQPSPSSMPVNPNIMSSNVSGADAISMLDPQMMMPPKPAPPQPKQAAGMGMNPQMMAAMQANPQMMAAFQQQMMMMMQAQRMGQGGGGVGGNSGMPNMSGGGMPQGGMGMPGMSGMQMNPQQMQQMMMMMQQQQAAAGTGGMQGGFGGMGGMQGGNSNSNGMGGFR